MGIFCAGPEDVAHAPDLCGRLYAVFRAVSVKCGVLLTKPAARGAVAAGGQ